LSILKKPMSESKLQSEMVISFSQQRPDEKGLLWATGNRTLSQRDGQKQKAMGLFAGVSDLIYFKKTKRPAIISSLFLVKFRSGEYNDTNADSA
jgi:hypothetical protein